MSKGAVIKYDLNTKEIRKSLTEYVSGLRDAIRKAIREISSQITKEARAIYGTEVQVTADSVRAEGNGVYSCVITAKGSQVVFIEFGAGDNTDEAHPYAKDAPVYVARGSWSSSEEGAHTKGKHPNYVDEGYWFYDGKRYNGILPRRVLYNAMLGARADAEDILAKRLNEVKQ